MSGPDPVRAAALALYAGDPATFVAARKKLAAAARADGDKAAATSIAALRKPTRAGSLLNRWVQAQPGAVGELLDLATRMRAAQERLDGPALRDLGTRRRALVGRLAADAGAGASAAVVDEIAGTLNSALADERVAGDLRQGLLVSAAEWSGFPGTGSGADEVGDDRGSAAEPAPGGTNRDDGPDDDDTDGAFDGDADEDEDEDEADGAGKVRRAEENRRAEELRRRAEAAAASARREAAAGARDAREAVRRSGAARDRAQRAVDELTDRLSAARDELALADAAARRAAADQDRADAAVARLDRAR